VPIVAKKYLNYLLEALASLQPAPQNCGAPNTFFIFFSRKGAEPQRNSGSSE
jgi:hypothetical protein